MHRSGVLCSVGVQSGTVSQDFVSCGSEPDSRRIMIEVGSSSPLMSWMCAKPDALMLFPISLQGA